MDPVTQFVIVGFVGGLVAAFIITNLQRRTGASADAFRTEKLSTDVINIARIRVAGIGGLGLVAMALAVALDVPRIGQTLAVGLVSGAVLAAILIGWRRGEGPLRSSGRKTGANTVLSIDTPASPPSKLDRDSTSMTKTPPVAPVPAK